MFFQHVDSIPDFKFGYWTETLSEWQKQGLPSEIDNEQNAYEYFGIENWHGVPVDVMCLRPSIEVDKNETKREVFTWYGQAVHVLDEREEYLIYRDEAGCVAKINKQDSRFIPQFLDFYLKDRSADVVRRQCTQVTESLIQYTICVTPSSR